MKRLLHIAIMAAVAAVALASCSGRDKVIPRGTMEKIYYDMFLADQWLAVHPEARMQADTSWFYEPIFQKYGYTHRDYFNSVDHYLNDPERYAAMMRRVTSRLEKEFNALSREVELEREAGASAPLPHVDAGADEAGFSVGAMMDFFEKQFPVDGWFKFCFEDKPFPFYGPTKIIVDTAAVWEISDSLGVEDAEVEQEPMEAVPAGSDSIAVHAPGRVRPAKKQLKEESVQEEEEVLF